ncbi:MAG: hypothetical protein Q9211_005685 [Gyalolechia sp. 1 TL-2023]
MVAHTSLDSILLELSWALFAITSVVLILRIFGELFIVRSFKLASWIALLAYLLALASQVMIALAVHFGLGKHIKSLDHHQTTMVQTYLWQAQPLQLLANTAGKVAIAALLVTLHGPRFAKAKTISIWTLAGLQVFIVLIAIALIYAQCTPVPKLWRNDLAGTCDGRVRNNNFAYVQGGVSSFVDLALAIYPMFLFWDLRIKFVKKMLLSLLFAFGIVTEMYLVLLAGSLPGLRPLFNKRMRTSSNRNSSSGYARRPSSQCDKKSFVMKLSSLPIARSKAYTGNGTRKNDGSTENILKEIGPRNIMKTTEVNVRSGRNSIRGHTPSNNKGEQHGTFESDLGIARATA